MHIEKSVFRISYNLPKGINFIFSLFYDDMKGKITAIVARISTTKGTTIRNLSLAWHLLRFLH
jgi:hypothetical protein